MNQTRRDAAATRQRILACARAQFAEHGVEATTVRGVAAAAGVSPNLITRYFGGKAGLFAAARSLDLGIAAVVAGPLDGLPARIAKKVVSRWESAPGDDPLRMMLRAAGSSEQAAAELGAFFGEQAVRPLAAVLDPARAPQTTAAVGALIMGVVSNRYILKAGPLASASPSELEAWLAEALRRLIAQEPLPPLRGLGS